MTTGSIRTKRANPRSTARPLQLRWRTLPSHDGRAERSGAERPEQALLVIDVGVDAVQDVETTSTDQQAASPDVHEVMAPIIRADDHSAIEREQVAHEQDRPECRAE